MDRIPFNTRMRPRVIPRVSAALLALCCVVPAAAQRPSFQDAALTTRQTEHCSILAPAGWSFTSNPQASSAEAVSPDRLMYAGWGGVAINRAMQSYYGPLYGDPDTSIRYLTSQILQGWLGDRSGVRYTSPGQSFLNYFTLRHVESAQFSGVVFYRIYSGRPGSDYVQSVYFALANKSLGSAGVRFASGVTASIRCQTQLRPVRFDPPPRVGKDTQRTGCGHGEGNLRGYNKELGSQYAHSPTTGQNYLFDAATQWRENGPQGPGYYAAKGNSYEKLELGRSDDC